MKILHVTRSKANPLSMNGVNIIINDLATTQVLQGHDVKVIAIARNKAQRHQPNYAYKLFKEPKIPIFLPYNLVSEIRKNSKDSIIHLHSVFIPWFPLLVTILYILGYKRLILTPHGGYSKNNITKRFFNLIYFFTIEQIVLNLVARIHFSYSSEANAFLKTFVLKSTCIPNGLNKVTIDYDFSKRHNLKFCFMGRLKIDHKGLDLLFSGFSKYKHSNGKGKLILIGDGPDNSKLREMAKDLGIESSVSFLGVLYGKQKLETMRSMTAFFHSSRWEGMPMSCLEAASVGLPLMISEETNLATFVKKYCCGKIIKPNTPFGISNIFHQVELLCKDKGKYTEMCSNSIKMINEELNWDNISQQIVTKLYLPSSQ